MKMYRYNARLTHVSLYKCLQPVLPSQLTPSCHSKTNFNNIYIYIVYTPLCKNFLDIAVECLRWRYHHNLQVLQRRVLSRTNGTPTHPHTKRKKVQSKPKTKVFLLCKEEHTTAQTPSANHKTKKKNKKENPEAILFCFVFIIESKEETEKTLGKLGGGGEVVAAAGQGGLDFLNEK